MSMSKPRNPPSLQSKTIRRNIVSRNDNAKILNHESVFEGLHNTDLTDDYVSLLLVCTNKDNGSTSLNEYFLSSSDYGLTFPFISKVPPESSWTDIVTNQLTKNRLLDLVTLHGVTRVNRWFVPGVTRMATHVVFVGSVGKDQKVSVSDTLNGHWFKTEDMEAQLFQSVDIYDIMTHLDKFKMGMTSSLMESVAENTIFPINRSKDADEKTGLDWVIEACEFEVPAQEELYKLFLWHSRPFFHIGKVGFGWMLMRLGWSDDMAQLDDLFRAFDFYDRGGLTFDQVLCGLAACEPKTYHGGASAEIRTRFLFRYFDRNNDGHLSREELSLMIARIHQVQVEDGSNHPSLLSDETKKRLKIFGLKDKIDLTAFLKAVGSLKFRGTSVLLRSPHSIIPILTKSTPKIPAQNYSTFSNKPQSSTAPIAEEPTRNLNNKQLVEDEAEPIEPSLRTPVSGVSDPVPTQTESPNLNSVPPPPHDYNIASHAVSIRKSGIVRGVNSLSDLQNTEMKMFDQAKTQKVLEGRAAQNRMQSMEVFKPDSLPNEMLKALKYFEKEIQSGPTRGVFSNEAKKAFHWGAVDRVALYKYVVTICRQTKLLFETEARCVHLASPVYIMGDLHGNFPDLITFEKALWRLGPVLTPMTFLFLGDYVDRGIFSLEVICYLFSQKLLAPDKFILLRGNHEIRGVQQMFTFLNEMKSKLGDAMGQSAWEEINAAFDYMPLSAVIDQKIFCVHGGIPPPSIGNGLLSAIETIPVPLPDPEQSSLAWELMWSDPLLPDTLSPEEKDTIVFKDGFGHNIRRGTAHLFTEEALNLFLERNGLTQVVRAHEVKQSGFQVQFGGKLVTIFSSSKYLGGSNNAACVLVDKSKLRMIKVE